LGTIASLIAGGLRKSTSESKPNVSDGNEM